LRSSSTNALYDARMLRVVAALALAGCFAPDPTVGAPCAVGVPESKRCPDGQFCVQHDGVETCETDDISDTPTDRDGDLILDGLDNCPDLANSDQSDEDLDRTGDACDPCPPFIGTDDTDGDKVGDACDPNPNTPGDRIVAFAGFSAPLPNTWTLTGQFIAAGGEGLATADDNASALATFASPTTGRVEVRAAGRLVSITAQASNLGAVNVVERFVPSTDRGIACQLATLANGDQQQLRIFDLDKAQIVNNAPHVITVGSEIDLRLRRSADQYNCRATNPVLEIAGTASFVPQAPRAGVRVRGAVAIFHWVMIVSSP
jgi:hypothetical protein